MLAQLRSFMQTACSYMHMLEDMHVHVHEGSMCLYYAMVLCTDIDLGAGKCKLMHSTHTHKSKEV